MRVVVGLQLHAALFRGRLVGGGGGGVSWWGGGLQLVLHSVSVLTVRRPPAFLPPTKTHSSPSPSHSSSTMSSLCPDLWPCDGSQPPACLTGSEMETEGQMVERARERERERSRQTEIQLKLRHGSAVLFMIHKTVVLLYLVSAAVVL